MSMDDQFWQMKQFHQELDNFNQNLQSSWQDVEAKYDNLSPIWSDEYRQEHDRVWEHLQEDMKAYLTRLAPKYIEFLASKSHALEKYLRGG